MGKSITLKTHEELQIMWQANKIVVEVLTFIKKNIASGINTWQLDRWAEEIARSSGSIPAFKGYRGYPASLCVSLNEEVVHGIPSKKVVIKEGDIVSIDFGVAYKGYYGDAAITIGVGKIDPDKAELMRITHEALYSGIEMAVVGNRVDDISRAVQKHVEQHGFTVVRQFVGHGIGTALHEGPEVPNYISGVRGIRLQSGMVLAIEPMVNMGKHDVVVTNDGWTVVTADGKPSAHFEHSVAVTDNGPLILTEMGSQETTNNIFLTRKNKVSWPKKRQYR